MRLNTGVDTAALGKCELLELLHLPNILQESASIDRHFCVGFRAEALKLRAEKAEKYALKVHRLLEAMRAHLEAAQRHEAAAQHKAHAQEPNVSNLKAQLAEAEQTAGAATNRAESFQVPLQLSMLSMHDSHASILIFRRTARTRHLSM